MQNQQWAAHADSDDRLRALEQRRQLHPQSPDETPFTVMDFQQALQKMKARIAPGPDQAANELFRLLDDDNTQLLLDFYNKVWEVEEVPDEWKEAIVVSIYKGKGVDTDPANYRPISLLNVIYKVFAAMLQSRIASQHHNAARRNRC